MRRVYFLYIVRTLLQPVVIKSLLVLALVLQMSRYVSFGSVVENMPSTYSGLPTFISGALANTESITLTLLAIALATGVWLIRDVFSHRTQIAHA